MINKTVITTKGREHLIESTDEQVINWFNDPEVTMVETILNQINAERLYDPVLAKKTGLTILDIGANIGLFSLYAQDSADKIICLEPAPLTFQVLQKLTTNINKITCAPYALSDSDGEIHFYIHDNPTINSIDVDYAGTKTTVQARTIQTVLNENNLTWVDFVKCDIEGSESRAITESTLEPVKDRIGAWFLEVHQTNNKETGWPGNLEQNRQRLISIFKNAGYNAEPIIHDQIFAWK